MQGKWTLSNRTMTEFFPGHYLYATRVRTGYGLVSYAWLEFLPAMMALMCVDLILGIVFAVAHWAFLGLYELGYIYNDRAQTAQERSPESRPKIPLHRWRVMLAMRLGVFGLAVGTVGTVVGRTQTALFCTLSVTTVLLLGLHTWIGSRVSRKDPRRWITFAWLAAFKYLPAASACIPLVDSVSLCLVLFLSYGAGRVLEYALTKHGAHIEWGPLDVNSAWFLATLPLAIVTLGQAVAATQGLLTLVALGSHHVTTTLGRIYLGQRERRFKS